MIEFVIPVNKDELLQRPRGPQYFVRNIVPIRLISNELDVCREALQENGANFILDHFETLFSIIVHGNKVEFPIIMRAFSRILKAIEMLIDDMEKIFDKGTTLEDDDRQKFLNVNKMLAYLYSWFVCYINEEIFKNSGEKYSGKKKSTKSDIEEEWERTRDKALEFLYRWLQLPLHRLWQPPVAEDAFITLLTKVCYKILEQCKDAKQKYTKQTLFEILGTAIKKYNHGINFVIRIIQLVKLHDWLAAHIANGVIHMVKDCGCTGLIKELVKEIEQTDVAEADSRNISIFFESTATSEPNFMIPILEDIADWLGSEHYTMRNCAIGILGSIVQKVLSGDDLSEEQKQQRDECLDNLENHIVDFNAYVRSKVLHVLQNLCCEASIPVARQESLLAAVTLRLEDKSANVRKQGLQLMRAILHNNPYAAKLNKTEISKSLEEEEVKLRHIQAEFVSKSARGDQERLTLWNTLLPDIRNALKEVCKSKKRKIREDSDTEDEAEEDEINPDTAFEHIRHLMLNRKTLEAVMYLCKVCTKLNETFKMEGLTPEAKEEFLFLLLLKTFMESEDNLNLAEDAINNKEPVKGDILKKEIKAQKVLVDYLKNSLVFATKLEAFIPIAKKLLFSLTASDAVEACTLLGSAYQFGIAGSEEAIRAALLQVFHRDQSVRNNVAAVYKDIYLNNDKNQKSVRQKILACSNALIDLVKGLQCGQSPALTQLILSWYNSQELNNEVLQILWEKFTMKIPETTAVESRAALVLITMIAEAESRIIIDNLELLIKTGLGPRAKTDLLLARDTCRALLKIKHESDDVSKTPNRFTNDHDMFPEILALFKEHFTSTIEDGYISFATDAINVIYHLANKPERLMKELIVDVFHQGKFNNSKESEIPSFLLAKFLYIIGHVAIREMVHLDTSVYKELKRRDYVQKLKEESKAAIGSRKGNKNARQSVGKKVLNISAASTCNQAIQNSRNKENASTVTEDNGEAAVGGASHDADAEFLNNVLENHIVTGDGLLAKFVPLVIDVCENPNKYNNEHVQAAAAIALSKMMTVSCQFCEKWLQLLFTILERSTYPGIRSDVLTAVSDLMARFPNEVEPWMPYVYQRLRDENLEVRRTCIRVLSTLIMKEMVRVRGQISELALCIVDKNEKIAQDAKQFFRELSGKGNVLYNVIPDILSRLTDPESNLDEDTFQEIIKNILSLLEKEKQVDSIIEKICARFKLSTAERQWCDFAFCLSLLHFSVKSIRHLIESLPLLKDKIHNPQVLKAFRIIIEQAKKKPITKTICIELEEKIKELLEGTKDEENSDNQTMPSPVKGNKKSIRRRRKHGSSSEEEEDDDVFEKDTEEPVDTAKEQSRKKKKQVENETNSSDSDTDVPMKNPEKRVQEQNKSTRSAKKLPDSKKSFARNSSTSSVKGNKQAVDLQRTSLRISTRLSQQQSKS